MKTRFIFLLFAPLLMATQCEDDDYVCGLSEPNPYVVNVENIKPTYALGEIIWLNSETSSQLFNSCNSNEAQELVIDNKVFRDAIFVLKLNNSLANLNAEIAQNYDVLYSIGEAFDGNYCSEALEYLPILSDDNLFYQYRLGISINTPGDYCIVSATNIIFLNTLLENNAQIFEPYNTLNNEIKFKTCGDIYTRRGTNDYYFFSVN